MAMAQGTRFPIGAHKGFGLCMLDEVLTSVMAQGCILDEKETADGIKNWSAHTAIAFKADALMDAAAFKKRAGELSRRATNLSPGLHIPGFGSYSKKKSFISQNSIDLEDGLVEKLNTIAQKLSVKSL
jgi:LDH2 family malate/lactate/ureidoglycolate dehydrogenase